MTVGGEDPDWRENVTVWRPGPNAYEVAAAHERLRATAERWAEIGRAIETAAGACADAFRLFGEAVEASPRTGTDPETP